ncbi:MULTISPECIES: hypothetical protein [Hymenobacter]|uniref:Uncharacterized protein n=1 Tax=Hymenobacter jejuensis TaxID=2502781 RepID=A0A5B8A361_9BACT|nr:MULTISPECIES: hypothetical protein [Hymenobacter]MBC6989591.1 hypothetical protein [Hymenobacter sp. BT491]QDA61607.1 hypothetical protein FHG12_16550 [Hymenobacter jejuensis]
MEGFVEDKNPKIPASAPGFFSADFTPEDLILYVFCFLLVGFVAFYFTSVNAASGADFMSAHDKVMVDRLALDAMPDDRLRANLIKAQLQIAYKRYEYGARFEHTNSLIKYIGFMVGTLLAILGAVVVVKGVRDSPIGFEAEGLERARIKFTASSPGVFLAFIGGSIIITTIVHGIAANVEDPTISVPIYPGDGFAPAARDTSQIHPFQTK